MLATSNTAGWAAHVADQACPLRVDQAEQGRRAPVRVAGQAGPLPVDQAEQVRLALARVAGQAGPLRVDQVDHRPVGRDND
jgi:hypothetical protein